MKKKYSSNAERQKAYRERHRNARPPRPARSAPLQETVTVETPPSAAADQVEPPHHDYMSERGWCIYLGDWGYGPQHALIVGTKPE